MRFAVCECYVLFLFRSVLSCPALLFFWFKRVWIWHYKFVFFSLHSTLSAEKKNKKPTHLPYPDSFHQSKPKSHCGVIMRIGNNIKN